MMKNATKAYGSPDVEDGEFLSALQAGAALAKPTEGDGLTPFIVVPAGWSRESLEDLLPQPMRRKATVKLESVESFTRYVGAFKTPDTQLFANPVGHTVTAILDYHQAGEDGDPSWATHSTSLQLKLSKPWQKWVAMNGQTCEQVKFAEFLEDNVEDIVEPDGAKILEVAKHLEAKKTVQFKSGVNLGNGAIQFVYDESIDGKGKGNVTVPGAFILGIPVYEHGEPYRVDVKLRYRITDDKLTFAIKLHRPERILDDAFAAVLQSVADDSGFQAFIGSATTG